MSEITFALVGTTVCSLVAYRIARSNFFTKSIATNSIPAFAGKPEPPEKTDCPPLAAAPRHKTPKIEIDDPLLSFSPGERIGTKRAKKTAPEYDIEGVTILLLTALLSLTAIYIILSKQYADSEQKWAYGVIGTITGFWFKTTKRR